MKKKYNDCFQTSSCNIHPVLTTVTFLLTYFHRVQNIQPTLLYSKKSLGKLSDFYAPEMSGKFQGLDLYEQFSNQYNDEYN